MAFKGIFPIEARRERIDQTKTIITKLAPIEYRKALAVVCMNLGIREETAREYIRVLNLYGAFEIYNGNIKIPKK